MSKPILPKDIENIVAEIAEETSCSKDDVKKLYLATGNRDFVTSSCKAIVASEGALKPDVIIQVYRNEKNKELKRLHAIGRQKMRAKNDFRSFVCNKKRK